MNESTMHEAAGVVEVRKRVWSVGELSPRQQEILRLLARGDYYREIGEALGISIFTVRTHLHAIYQRLQVNSRARAVIKYHEHLQGRTAVAG